MAIRLRNDLSTIQLGAPHGCGQQCVAWNKRSTLATLFNLYPRTDIVKAIEILDRLGVAEHASKRAEALSGGQQQRVAIARALMQDPKIILAVEPIASLDPMNAQIVMDTLRRIHEEDNRMVVANLHTLDLRQPFCARSLDHDALGRMVRLGHQRLYHRRHHRSVGGLQAA